jgi:hypothetical protein
LCHVRSGDAALSDAIGDDNSNQGAGSRSGASVGRELASTSHQTTFVRTAKGTSSMQGECAGLLKLLVVSRMLLVPLWSAS